MRVAGLIGLVLALVLVGLLARNRMGATAGAPVTDAPARGQQVRQQLEQSLDAAMQQARPVADDN